ASRGALRAGGEYRAGPGLHRDRSRSPGGARRAPTALWARDSVPAAGCPAHRLRRRPRRAPRTETLVINGLTQDGRMRSAAAVVIFTPIGPAARPALRRTPRATHQAPSGRELRPLRTAHSGRH